MEGAGAAVNRSCQDLVAFVTVMVAVVVVSVLSALYVR